jgi:ribonuclease HII
MLKSYYNIDAVEAGLDEVGRGCLAGPVVAAAADFAARLHAFIPQ